MKVYSLSYLQCFLLISASRYQKKDKKKESKEFVNVSSFKVWKMDDNNAPSFTDDFQVAKFAMFRGEVF